MKKFFTIFFVTLGVIFLIIILIASYLYFTTSSKTKSTISGSDSKIADTLNNFVEKASSDEPTITEDKNPALNDSQEKALETFGVDPADLPSELTLEQITCFESILGEARVSEIKAGDSPTAMEYFKARECI